MPARKAATRWPTSEMPVGPAVCLEGGDHRRQFQWSVAIHCRYRGDHGQYEYGHIHGRHATLMDVISLDYCPSRSHSSPTTTSGPDYGRCCPDSRPTRYSTAIMPCPHRYRRLSARQSVEELAERVKLNTSRHQERVTLQWQALPFMLSINRFLSWFLYMYFSKPESDDLSYVSN